MIETIESDHVRCNCNKGIQDIDRLCPYCLGAGYITITHLPREEERHVLALIRVWAIGSLIALAVTWIAWRML